MLYKKKRDTEGSCCLEPPSSSCQELSSWSAELRLEYLGTHAPVLPLLGLPVASLVHKVGLPGDGVPSLMEPQWLVALEPFAWMGGGGERYHSLPAPPRIRRRPQTKVLPYRKCIDRNTFFNGNVARLQEKKGFLLMCLFVQFLYWFGIW